jgi:hypothetical protein
VATFTDTFDAALSGSWTQQGGTFSTSGGNAVCNTATAGNARLIFEYPAAPSWDTDIQVTDVLVGNGFGIFAGGDGSAGLGVTLRYDDGWWRLIPNSGTFRAAATCRTRSAKNVGQTATLRIVITTGGSNQGVYAYVDGNLVGRILSSSVENTVWGYIASGKQAGLNATTAGATWGGVTIEHTYTGTPSGPGSTGTAFQDSFGPSSGAYNVSSASSNPYAMTQQSSPVSYVSTPGSGSVQASGSVSLDSLGNTSNFIHVGAAASGGWSFGGSRTMNLAWIFRPYGSFFLGHVPWTGEGVVVDCPNNRVRIMTSPGKTANYTAWTTVSGLSAGNLFLRLLFGSASGSASVFYTVQVGATDSGPWTDVVSVVGGYTQDFYTMHPSTPARMVPACFNLPTTYGGGGALGSASGQLDSLKIEFVDNPFSTVSAVVPTTDQAGTIQLGYLNRGTEY